MLTMAVNTTNLLDDYEEVSPTVVASSKWLVDIWEKLGRPNTPLSESGAKMVNVILAVWKELSPQEAKEWHESRKTYKLNELDAKEQIRKHTGRSLASYPFLVFHLLRRIFPDFKFGDRDNCLKLVRKFPVFMMTNKA